MDVTIYHPETDTTTTIEGAAKVQQVDDEVVVRTEHIDDPTDVGAHLMADGETVTGELWKVEDE